jgi:hypothetical protein
MVLENLVTTIGPAKIGDYIANPKGSRLFQQFIKLGTKEHRNAAIAALAKSVPDLAVRNIYALLTLEKIITYGLKTDEAFTTDKWLKPVMTDRKTVEQLLFHRLGCKFLNKLYLHATIKPALKKQMMQLILVPRNIELLGESKDKLRVHYLESIKKCVDKELLGLAVIHKLFRQAICVDFSDDHKFSEEALSMAADGLPHMLSSRDGVVVVVRLMGLMSAKHKKNFIKEMKGKFFEVAKNPVTMVVLIRLFECTDDTVLIGKSVLTELIGSDYTKGKELLDDPVGRTPFMYILEGLEFKTGKFYNSQDREIVKDIPLTTSVKDRDIKSTELRAKIIPSLVKICTNHMDEMLSVDSMLVTVARAMDSNEVSAFVHTVIRTASPSLVDPTQEISNCINSFLKEFPEITAPMVMAEIVRLVGEASEKDVVVGMCTSKSAFVLLQLLKIESVSSHVKAFLMRNKKDVLAIDSSHKGTELIVKELSSVDSSSDRPSLETTAKSFPLTLAVVNSTQPAQKKQKTESSDATQLFGDDDEEEEDEELWGIVGDDDEY